MDKIFIEILEELTKLNASGKYTTFFDFEGHINAVDIRNYHSCATGEHFDPQTFLKYLADLWKFRPTKKHPFLKYWNMTSKQKQNNRYAAAERRILRVRYPQNPAARKLCQLDEQRNRYSKAIDEVFGGMYRRGFRPGIDNENPAFLADFDLINRWQKEQERIARRVARIEQASGKTTEQALHEKYLLNAGRGSQSY